MTERARSFHRAITPHLDPRAATHLIDAARRLSTSEEFRRDPGAALADYVEAGLSFLTAEQQDLALLALAAAAEENAGAALNDLDDEQQRELQLLMNRYEQLLDDEADIAQRLAEISAGIVANLG